MVCIRMDSIHKFTFCIIIFFVISLTHGQNGSRVDVNTGRGPVFGFHFDQGNDTSKLYYGQADVFLGIPFVQPPVGLLRYKKPQRLNQFTTNPYNATYLRPSCPQDGQPEKDMTENCLFLNIYSPNVKSTSKYATMVWIHGGGLKVGSGHLNLPGVVRNLVSRGIVVVSLQYRLGFLGFFTTFTDDFPPNLGMLDQVEALRFVQEEITNFGGAPTKVTIAGQSAGSASVSAHTYSPISKGLFHQAIQESGSVLTCFEESLGSTNRNYLLTRFACNFTEEMWNSRNYSLVKDCLYNIDLPTGIKYGDWAGKYKNAVCWNMAQDNYFFPDVPRNLYKNRPNIPILIGTNKDEFALWEYELIEAHRVTLDNYTKMYAGSILSENYERYFGNDTRSAINEFESVLLKNGTTDDDHLAWLQFLTDAGTSTFFTGFTARDVEQYIQNKNPNVYLYEFTYSTAMDSQNYPVPGWKPVPHNAEVYFVFMPDYAWSGRQNSVFDIAIANFMGDAWANFVKTGRPNSKWNPTISIGINSMEYFEIGLNSIMRQGYRSNDRVLMNQDMPALVGVFPPEVPDYNNGSNINP